MITLKEFLEVIDYRITSSSIFLGKCFGKNTYVLNGRDKKDIAWAANVVFDTVTQEVYQIEMCDFFKENTYQYTNVDYADAYKKEYFESDSHQIIVLECQDDWLEKATAIVNRISYDERVVVPLTLPEEDIVRLMKMAHERDITFNQLVTDIMIEHIIPNKISCTT